MSLSNTLLKFVNNTNKNIFLTGKAGTGKTTLLHKIQSSTHKNVVVAAPTGIAAINAKGVTLHSLFQLPFGAFIPDNNGINAGVNSQVNTPRTLLSNLQMHKNKRNLIKKMELLVIDEVSMMRADLLDAIDVVLRSVRRKRDLPFGGVQVLFIGDMQQLPPVVRDDEMRILSPYYNNCFFFNAQVVKSNPPLYVELEKIYRQSDETFIKLLNNLRNNIITKEDSDLLNNYYKPNYKQAVNDGVILLTTHNRIADQRNFKALNDIQTKSINFEAQVTGEFSEYSYPTDKNLELKKGAQVMFTKNDYSGEQLYFNGKIGVISSLSKNEIEVSFSDGSSSARVEPYTWENKKYSVNPNTNELEENIVGKFEQYPLKLAWAITVHKSQGLTFDKAVLDVANAFAPGQIYVALSRLRSLDGLILTSPIPKEGIQIDPSLAEYAKQKKKEDELIQLFEGESKMFLEKFVTNSFDFANLLQELNYHYSTYTKDARRSEKQKNINWAKELIKSTDSIKVVADNFRNQVQKIIQNNSENNVQFLKERVDKAIEYFEPLFCNLYDQVRVQVKQYKGKKGAKAYYNELIDVSNLYYGQLQQIYKAQAIIKSAIDGSTLDKNEIKKPKVEIEDSSVSNESIKTKKTKKPKVKKENTKKVSYDMYKEGKTVAEIAAERSLIEGTIEGHLSHYILTGELDITEFLTKEKISVIEKEVHKQDTTSLTPIKEALGKEYSYGDIRMVMAYLQKQTT